MTPLEWIVLIAGIVLFGPLIVLAVIMLLCMIFAVVAVGWMLLLEIFL
jgi:hypothetical protein